MNDMLAGLFAAKAAVLREDQAREPLAAVVERGHARQHERRNFRAALEAGRGFGFIAEIKHASPSLGSIVDKFDPVEIARRYHAAGVDAMSVLTEESGFRGDIRYLDIVRAETTVPLLRKDFLSSPYQIAQAAAYGADAVLLIVAALDDTQLRELIDYAGEFNLDALVEVHDEEEAIRARAVGATLIGINNRDLRTFQVDIATTERLLPYFSTNSMIVAESGVHNAGDVARLSSAGARAFLIGEAMMRAADPAELARQFRNSVI